MSRCGTSAQNTLLSKKKINKISMREVFLVATVSPDFVLTLVPYLEFKTYQLAVDYIATKKGTFQVQKFFIVE
jgi:hypothetical protein